MRVHDLAAEFGMTSEDLMNLLREMDIFVRSHMSALEEAKVARVRARIERDKRAAKTKAEPAKGRRRAAAKKTAAAPEPAPAPAAEAAKPKRRRRTAAEVADREAEAAAAAAAEAEVERPAEVTKLFADAGSDVKELPPPVDVKELFPPELAPPETEPEERMPLEMPEPVASAAPPPPPPPPVERPLPMPYTGGRRESQPPTPVQRPMSARPAGPRPVASAAPGSGVPPRPIASAAPGAGTAEERRRGKKKGKKGGKKGWVDQEAVAENVAKTLASIRSGPVRKGGARRREDEGLRAEEAARVAEEKEREKTVVRVNEFVSVAELAQSLKVPAAQVVTFCFKELGMMVTVNQRLDFDQIDLICSEFGFKAVREEEYAVDIPEEQAADTAEQLVPRPPVVTVMGHVDHGKTSLLDYIRKTNVVAGESGGITQHIGAYHVELANKKRITFLDTPGHQAFTAMRARGAQVTDIVILVVAADDAIMPQTIEAISHAKNAGVPLVVAINKIDLPSANVQKVKQDLLQHQVVLEEFGGTTLATPISAKKGTGIPELLDQVLLQAELLDLKANPARHAHGTVIEASLDPGRGPVATVLITNGTLHAGDNFICGMHAGRVRALQDERGRALKEAGPSIPVQVLGFDGVPQAGDTFTCVEDANKGREIAQIRQRLDREAQNRRTSRAGMSLEEFFQQRAEGEVAALRLIIKADQGGPAEALADALSQLSTSEVRVEVVHRGVGAITDSDVLLAKASQAIIIGFHVRPDSNARASATREHVDIKQYRVIYEAVEDVKAALEGMLKPEQKEVVLGEAEVRQLFKISGIGVIAGCYVRSGIIQRTAKARVIRDAVQVYEGSLSSLRRFKDDVKEVKDGLECGIGIENFNDLKVGDTIEAFRVEQVARTLEAAGQPRSE